MVPALERAVAARAAREAVLADATGVAHEAYAIGGRLVAIDGGDVAEVAAKVLTTESHENQIYVLTGPASISFTEVAGELSKALDKQVTYVSVPLEAAREAMLGMGMPEWGADAFCEYYENHSNGGNDFTTNEVETLTGHPARSYETFARDFGPYFVGA